MQVNLKCIKTHIFETEIINLGDGIKKMERFEIAEGMTGICKNIYHSNKGVTIKLDNPLTAINENEPHFNSKIHRIFVKKNSIRDVWVFNK